MKNMATNDLLNDIASATDERLLDWLVNGVQATDKAGTPLLDEDGNPIMRDIGAKEMAVILARLRQCDVTAPAVPGSPLAAAAKAAAARGGYPRPAGIPPISTDENEARTA